MISAGKLWSKFAKDSGRKNQTCRPLKLRVASIEESKFDDEPQSRDAILPSDLLAFRIISSAVGDWNLINPKIVFSDLIGDLRLKTEEIAFQSD